MDFEVILSREVSFNMTARKRNKTVTVLILIAIAGLVLKGFFNFIRSFEDGRFCECNANLREISNALEIYANDNNGLYPLSLTLLIPKYTKELPKCKDDYLNIKYYYQLINKKGGTPGNGYYMSYKTSDMKDNYTIYCYGNRHHPFVKTNFPQYDSFNGLIEK